MILVGSDRKLTGILLGSLVLAVIFTGNFIILSRQVKKLDAEEVSRRENARRYTRLKGGVPSQEKLTHYLIRRDLLERKYQSIKEEFGTLLKAKGPSVRDPLRFKQTLLKEHQELRRSAQASGVDLPQRLGLEEYYELIPGPDKVPELFMQLEAIKSLIELSANSGINSLESITLSQPVLVTEVTTYREFRFELTVNCTTRDLVRFLYGLRKQDVLFIIRDLKISAPSPDTNLLKAELNISSIVFI